MPGEVLLHLTDLHFGWDTETSKLAERKVVLDSLIEQVASLHHDWKPTIVCVTGDIGWRGSAKDYAEAEAWLKRLLDRVGLTFADVLVCAGNHDVDRSQATTFSRPRDHAEADQVLRVPVARHYLDCFPEFTDFCKRVGVRGYSFNKQESYLLGQTDHQGIRFVAVNSAWFCKGEDDKNKLWVGLPHLRQMEADGQLQKVSDSPPLPVVVLIHHPDDWWHDEEVHAYTQAEHPRLPRRSMPPTPERAHPWRGPEGRPHRPIRSPPTGGAAFAGASHFNSFRVIRIKPDSLTYRSFEYDPRSSDNKWRDHGASDKLPFVDRPLAPLRTAATEGKEVFDPSHLRSDAGRDAKTLIEVKSRQLKPIGNLPATVPLGVSVRVTSQVDRYDSQGRLGEYKDQFVSLPLYEACRQSRRTVLLGDLGAARAPSPPSLSSTPSTRTNTGWPSSSPPKLSASPTPSGWTNSLRRAGPTSPARSRRRSAVSISPRSSGRRSKSAWSLTAWTRFRGRVRPAFSASRAPLSIAGRTRRSCDRAPGRVGGGLVRDVGSVAARPVVGRRQKGHLPGRSTG